MNVRTRIAHLIGNKNERRRLLKPVSQHTGSRPGALRVHVDFNAREIESNAVKKAVASFSRGIAGVGHREEIALINHSVFSIF